MNQLPLAQVNYTANQLSFSLFEEARKTATPLADITGDIGFNRNRVLLDVKEVGLVALRAMDAAYFLISQDPDLTRTDYDFDLTYFKWLMAYDSNNRTHLLQAFREIQKSAITVTRPGKEDGAAVPLMGRVSINSGRIAFKVDEMLLPSLKKPQFSSYLSLRMAASFSSAYPRHLYYHLNAIAFRGGTEWMELEELRTWLGAESKTLAQFKYFRRDVLDPAVDQINDKSDIFVRYETKSAQGSKRITHLKLIVSKNPNYISGLINSGTIASQTLYQTLKEEFGLNDHHIEEITQNRASWSDDWIYQAIDFTRAKIEQGKVKTSPAGYLMKAIRENLKLSLAERKMLDLQNEVKSNAKIREAIKDGSQEETTRRVTEETIRGAEKFDGMDDETKKRAILAFGRHPTGKIACNRAKVTPKSLTEEVIRGDEIISRAFGSFVFVSFKIDPVEDAA